MRNIGKACAAAALAGMLAPAWAYAQEDYRQTVVVTAAATPVELGTVTRTMTVLTREEIAQLPVRSVVDVLRLATSIDVRARGGDGIQTDFSVRGASFGQMLVLVDGVRLNDAQSGHHNGDIPVTLDAIERIEVMYGAGSSLFGADAFGGTVNIITRRGTAPASLTVQGGSFDLAAGRGQISGSRGSLTETLSASVDRSSGFMYDRDFMTTAVQSRTAIGSRSDLSIAYLWKEFGANNFYGGRAPSREWTNQTLIAGTHRFGAARGWTFTGGSSYRTHGDHFVFNQTNPALSDNEHRTHEILGSLSASTGLPRGGRLTLGAEGGGSWIRSTNLGDHSLDRVSGFGEWRQALGRQVQVDAGLRVDRYTEFGASWSPSAGIGWAPTDRVRVRASAGRAFRVPTFTERYYSDPANLANADVGPEHSWSGEGGVDLFLARGWVVQGTIFGRADRDVIDWLCADTSCGSAGATERWHTFNVRDVTTKGAEVSVRRLFANGAFAQIGYTGLTLDAPAVVQMSKYLLDYAPRTLAAAGSIPLPARVRIAPRLEYRKRTRSTGNDDYMLFDLRVARPLGSLFDVSVDGTNLFDRSYQEISGVDMPGRAVVVSLSVRGK